MKVIQESKHYVVIRFPKENYPLEEALGLLEQIRAEGYRPLHRLEYSYQNCFVCEKLNLEKAA